MGVSIVGIIDRNGGLINEQGYSFEEIRQLFLTKEGNKLISNQMQSFEEVNSKIWDVSAEIFAPCAASRLVNKDQLQRLINNGLETVSCGANVPFADKEIFFGPIAEYADQNIALIPDFISNCGMARVFAYLMHEDVEVSDDAIFHDTSTTIKKALAAVHEKGNTIKNITSKAFEIALKQLV